MVGPGIKLLTLFSSAGLDAAVDVKVGGGSITLGLTAAAGAASTTGVSGATTALLADVLSATTGALTMPTSAGLATVVLNSLPEA